MDRPPPTSYRDEQERWHPGPGADGHAAHLAECWSCCKGVILARGRAEIWAMRAPLPDRLPPVPMPAPGPGVTRGELARRWHEGQPVLRPTPTALVVWSIAAATGLVVALLPTTAAVVVSVAIWVCAVLVTRWRRDVVPAARMLRR